MTSANLSSPVASAVQSIHRLLTDLCDHEHHYSFENPRRFSGLARRLHLVVNQLLLSVQSPSLETLPSSVQTALKGVSGDLSKAAEVVSVYEKSSKIFVLINCKSLCSSLLEHTFSIGGWLALLDEALQDHPDLQKKASDLSRDMKLAQFRVISPFLFIPKKSNEERVQCTLEKEGTGRPTTKAVQSAIVMDLARSLGIDPGDHIELSNEIKLFKNDLLRSNSVTERRILTSLERILNNWSIEPDIETRKLDFDLEDDAAIFPFKNFLCPLTKEVMKNPVVVETSQTYERTAIEYWFERCIEDARDPTCPVTGNVLKSLELKPNIGLAGAIEEWVNRVVEYQVKSAAEHLTEEPLCIDHVERALDNIYKVSEEHPASRYVIRNAGIVQLIVKLLTNSSKIIGSRLRSKALMALVTLAKDEESKKIMLEGSVTRLAVHSLIGSTEKEREYAVKLLLEFTSDEACCIMVASEKGALVLLTSMAGNLESPALSKLAEEVLRQLERVEDNVQRLAAAGRFEPLLSRLHGGPDTVRIEMASLLGRMTLTNSNKEQIARQSAGVLVDLLSKSEGREPSLQALYNLSGLDDNATILVEPPVFPSLIGVLFDDQEPSDEIKTLAASTIANIVSKPGRWELASADTKGNSMQSENIVFRLLQLLDSVSSQCQVYVLRILYGITSSPQASESVALHIKSGDGFKTVANFLEHPEVELRIYALKLLRLLSELFSQGLGNELRLSNKLTILKEKMLDDQSAEDERATAACILANLSLTEDELKSLLGGDFIRWIVATLQNQRRGSNARVSRTALGMLEGLLGLLLQFTRSLNEQTLTVVRENHLMTIFCQQLEYNSKPKVKRLAALGLKSLSEFGRAVISRDSEPSPSSGFCSPFLFICGRTSNQNFSCPFHNSPCEEESQLCLFKTSCIKPLNDLFSDNDTSVQVAAVEALSTLILDYSSNSFKRAVDELEQLGVVDSVIKLFTEASSGELQEKTIWIIEKILRVENHIPKHSLNQSLVRGLVEAFKHGNPNAKLLAQDALTYLKQISVLSERTSSQPRARR
ncbi:U-box domain-containing protein 44-like isoform X2 [Prosopis cineraria]|nr:U-box domain-containing protein 44-like isoform X2 [Prosopis cineraria]